jgi:hypothetical protein
MEYEKLKKGTKIKNKKNGKVFIYESECSLGFPHAWVEGTNDYVYLEDFEILEESEDNVNENKNDRRRWFYYLFEQSGHDIDSMSKILGIKRDSLYKKMSGINGFNEKDIDLILKALSGGNKNFNFTYESVFKQEGRSF